MLFWKKIGLWPNFFSSVLPKIMLLLAAPFCPTKSRDNFPGQQTGQKQPDRPGTTTCTRPHSPISKPSIIVEMLSLRWIREFPCCATSPSYVVPPLPSMLSHLIPPCCPTSPHHVVPTHHAMFWPASCTVWMFSTGSVGRSRWCVKFSLVIR